MPTHSFRYDYGNVWSGETNLRNHKPVNRGVKSCRSREACHRRGTHYAPEILRGMERPLSRSIFKWLGPPM